MLISGRIIVIHEVGVPSILTVAFLISYHLAKSVALALLSMPSSSYMPCSTSFAFLLELDFAVESWR